MPKIHPRERLCMKAESRLRMAILKLDEEFELTRLEHLQVLQTVLGDVILNACKYGIRQERHGNTDTPGGWESDNDG